MATVANKPARKPVAAKVASLPAPVMETAADRLAAALSGLAFPAADKPAAWLALLAELPALAEIVAASRAGKYGANKGLVNGASDMLSVTPYGAEIGARGWVKNSKPNAQAATCRATMAACAALQADSVCKAAVTFFMLTDSATLALLRDCKAVKYVAGATPCPAWCGGYINGNLRADMLRKA